MDLRKHMEYLVRIGNESCDDDIGCSNCPFGKNKVRDCNNHIHRVELAKQWLADHPEHPAEPERYYKGATRGDTTYSLSLSAGRISLFRWHGKNSESMDFGGTVADFNQFDDERPEEWFDVAAKMIGERK